MNSNNLKSNKQFKLSRLLSLLAVASLTACNGGGGGSSGGTSSSDGGSSSSLSIQSIATVSSILNTSYSPSCLYEYGNSVFLINSNGSGTGYRLSLSNGQVSQVTGLPKINLANGDQCLSNYQQLTWINSASPWVVNVYNPFNQLSFAVNLGQSGITGTEIANSSFDLSGNVLYANNNFLSNGQFGFSSLSLPDPTSYSQLNNSLYANRDISTVLYGFDGAGSQFLQLLPTSISTNQPAAIAYIQTGTGTAPLQNLSTITDSNNQPINAMSTAWDFTSGGNGVIVTTGLVQPVIYKCPLVGAYAYQCNSTYTTTEFTTKYRVMRLLGGNASYVYFMGMDLTKADIEIFSIKL